MPGRFAMNLDNNSQSALLVAQYKNALTKMNATKKPSALNASMVQRIHNVRPGCGSCGK